MKNGKKNGKVSNAQIKALAARMRAASTRKKKNGGNRKRPTMGAVSSITTAPVAIGNSVRGSASTVTRNSGGVTLTGRDFMFTPIGTGSIATWTMVGGTPLAPAAFADSNIRQYMQMYQKYRWRACAVHYITSSPTSSTGDVMFYHAKNRDSVFLNQTSSMLLPFVISDASSVIGPQWTNHSTQLAITGTWKSTDYGMNSDISDYADGEVFLLSKTTTTDSPGYVLFDYVIEFAQLQLSPRLLTLPLPRAQYWNTTLLTTGAKTIHNPVILNTGGTNISGATATVPPGSSIGDIYKMIVDVTNSTFTVGTAANIFETFSVGSYSSALTLVDGFTCYLVQVSTNVFVAVANAAAAYALSSGDTLASGATLTFDFKLQVWLSLVGSIATSNLIPNF